MLHPSRPADTSTSLTAIEYAAIHLRVPSSGTEWIDDMVKESLRNSFAAAAMTGELSSQSSLTSSISWSPKTVFESSYDTANEFMKEAALYSVDITHEKSI